MMLFEEFDSKSNIDLVELVASEHISNTSARCIWWYYYYRCLSQSNVQNYVEEIVPLYSDVQFREHFRKGRTTFEVGVVCRRYFRPRNE